MSTTHFPRRRRTGFTLVEILTVIVIIGILAGIAIPAINGAVVRARQTAQKLEVNSIAQAVDQYFQEYGDYPPDGSNSAVLTRHMRKLFPRMAEPDLTLLDRLTDNSVAGDATGVFSPGAMDRAEALVFFLGGFSKDVQRPLTGTGGPLDYVGPATATAAEVTDLSNYQYNATRDNAFFVFEPARLTFARATDIAPLLSTDETLVGNTAPAFGGADPLPTYLADERNPAPIVYFDSRTYGVIGTEAVGTGTRNIYNGYLSSVTGGVRPYKTEAVVEPPAGTDYGTEANAFAAIPFHNVDTYQIVSPGSDGLFGSIVSTSATDAGAIPTIHFVTESGRPVGPDPAATTPADLYYTATNLGSRGYQDGDWLGTGGINGHLDNVTNFSTAVLENDLQE